MGILSLIKNIFKLAQLSEKAKVKILERFEKKSKELDIPFDRGHALRLIELWDRLRRSPKTKSLVKQNIYEYDTLDELESELSSIVDPSEEHNTKYLRNILNKFLVVKKGDLEAYEISGPENSIYLSLAATGSAWCIRDTSTAEDYLKDSTFVIVRSYRNDDKEGIPVYAIQIGEEQINIFSPSDVNELSESLSDYYDDYEEEYEDDDTLEEQDTVLNEVQLLDILLYNIQNIAEDFKLMTERDPMFSNAINILNRTSKKIEELSIEFGNTKEFYSELFAYLTSIRDDLYRASIKNFFRRISDYSISTYDDDLLDSIVNKLFEIYKVLNEYIFKFMEAEKQDKRFEVVYGDYVEVLERLFSKLYKISLHYSDKSKVLSFIDKLNPIDFPVYIKEVVKKPLPGIEKSLAESMKNINPEYAKGIYKTYYRFVVERNRMFGREYKNLSSNLYGDLTKDFKEIFFRETVHHYRSKVRSYISNFLREVAKEVGYEENLEGNQLEFDDFSLPLDVPSITGLVYEASLADHYLAGVILDELLTEASQKLGVDSKENKDLLVDLSFAVWKNSFDSIKASNYYLFNQSDFLYSFISNASLEIEHLLITANYIPEAYRFTPIDICKLNHKIISHTFGDENEEETFEKLVKSNHHYQNLPIYYSYIYALSFVDYDKIDSEEKMKEAEDKIRKYFNKIVDIKLENKDLNSILPDLVILLYGSDNKLKDAFELSRNEFAKEIPTILKQIISERIKDLVEENDISSKEFLSIISNNLYKNFLIAFGIAKVLEEDYQLPYKILKSDTLSNLLNDLYDDPKAKELQDIIVDIMRSKEGAVHNVVFEELITYLRTGEISSTLAKILKVSKDFGEVFKLPEDWANSLAMRMSYKSVFLIKTFELIKDDSNDVLKSLLQDPNKFVISIGVNLDGLLIKSKSELESVDQTHGVLLVNAGYFCSLFPQVAKETGVYNHLREHLEYASKQVELNEYRQTIYKKFIIAVACSLKESSTELIEVVSDKAAYLSLSDRATATEVITTLGDSPALTRLFEKAVAYQESMKEESSKEKEEEKKDEN